MTAVLTMTPKLKLNDEDKNASLSWILKSRHPGKHWIILSTQMRLAPTMQAKGVYGSVQVTGGLHVGLC